MSGCELCGAPANLKCSKCRTTYYCCKDHQIQDWGRHKVMCQDSSLFPKHVLGKTVTINPTQPCYLSIEGDIIDTKGGEFKVDKKIPITPEQLLRFTESPSHLVFFMENELLNPFCSFMQELHERAVANKLLCSNEACHRRAQHVYLDSACILNFSPANQKSNCFPLKIHMNQTFCGPSCFEKIIPPFQKALAEFIQNLNNASKANWEKNGGKGKRK